MDFHSLDRKKLQQLCKKHGIPANLKTVEMANRLFSLLIKEEIPEKAETGAKAKRGRSCLKNVSENVEVEEGERVIVGSKEMKKVRFSPENQTFLFERTDPRAVRLLARKKRAFVNSRQKKDPVGVSVNLKESERLAVVFDDVGRVAEPVGNDEYVVKLAVKGGDLGRNLRSRRGEVILETVSKEENVVKGRNSRRSLVKAKDLGLESENVDCVEKLPTKEGNLELNLRTRRGKMKQDNVEVVSLLSDCGGGGGNVDEPVEGRKPKRSLRSRGGIVKENGVGGASLLSPCVEKKAKRGRKGKGIAEEGGGEEVDRPQNEVANHGGNVGRVTRKHLRNVDVVAVDLGRDDDCVAEVSELDNLKKRGRPRKSARLAEHSPEMILEPLENKGIKRGRRKTLMVKQHDINVGKDAVVEKLGEGNNMDGNGSRVSAKKSRKNVKDGNIKGLGDIRRSSRRAAMTKDGISVVHQISHHDERMDHMIEDDSQLESKKPQVNEQHKATEEVNVQVPVNDETTSLLRNNGDDEANKSHECPDFVVATEVNVQIPITNVGDDGIVESATRSRRNDKNGSARLDYIRKSGRRAAKNTVDISRSHQAMHHVEHIDHMTEDDSQMAAQLHSRSPEVNEQYPATGAVDVQKPVNDDSESALLRNRDDDDEANKVNECPAMVVLADYNTLDENAAFCSMTAQKCGTSEPICSSAIQPTSLRSRESVCVREDTNIMRNCEDFESNGVPELHDFEVNEQSKKEEESEEFSSPSKDNAMGSELLGNSAIFVDNLNAQPTEPSKVCGTTEPSSFQSDTNIMMNSVEFENNGAPQLHDYEMNEQSREDEGSKELSSPFKDLAMGSELLEVSETIIDKLDVQLTEQSKVSGSTGACNSICAHDKLPSSSRSDTNIMESSEDFESNGVPELHDYEMIKQSTEDEVFEELSSPCKDNTMGSVLLEVSDIVDKLDVQLTEQSKNSGACNSICLPEMQLSNSQSDVNIMKNSEGFESNGATELHDCETNEQAEDEGFGELSSPCEDNATGSELLGTSAVIVDKFDAQLTEQLRVSGSTGAPNSTFKEADKTISEISAAEENDCFGDVRANLSDAMEKGEESFNDTSGGTFLCSANVCKTDPFVEIDKTTLEQSKQAKKTLELDIQPLILEDDFISTTEASSFTPASCDSASMKPNIDDHYGATRDNFSVEQKRERFSDAIAFSPSSSGQVPVTHNTMQVQDYSNGESGPKKAHENAEQYVQTLANAAGAALYQSTSHVGADYTFQEDKFIPPPCNSKEDKFIPPSLRSTEAQYDNSTSEQQELTDNSKDFEYCLHYLFSEADILDTNEIKGLRSINDEEDLKETRSVSQVTVSQFDSSLTGQVADDIEGPRTDDMYMDGEDLKETHSVTQEPADSSLRKQVENDSEGPSTDDMEVDNNQNYAPPLNGDSETKICSTGKSNTILAALVSMELLKDEHIEEATQIPPSTLPLKMAYNMRLSEECDGEKESEMNSPASTNHGGSNPSSIPMTVRCTEVQEEYMSTPPIIVQETLNDKFESDVGLAKSPENEDEIGYNMAGSNVGLTEQEEVGRSRQKSDIIYGECGDGEWPTKFISDEKLEVGGEASVKGRVQSPSVMEESTPRVSSATLRKLMEDAKDVLTVTRTRLQDGASDVRSKKRKSESDISVQTSSSYLKTRVIGEPTVFSGSMEKGEESCKESTIGDIACSGNSRKVDYLKFIQKSDNEDTNNLVFEDDLMNFDKERDLEFGKTSKVTEYNDEGHYVFSQDKKLNESPNEVADNIVFEDELMNFDKERGLESDKTLRVTEGNDGGHHVSSQHKKSSESANEDADDLDFEDDLMNFDEERDLESDKTLRGTEGNDEGHHVSSQDKKSNESANEDANNLVFEDDLMNFDKERALESDKTAKVTEVNDGGQYISSQDRNLNELQFHPCSNGSNADLSSFITGLMEKDISEMFQAEETGPLLSHDETNHKLNNLFANQFPHENDSKPAQDGNIVTSEAEEFVAWNSVMQMHHEASEASFNPMDNGITGQNQVKFSSRNGIHANCVADVTEINEDGNLAKEGLYPLSNSEKKTGEMDEVFEAAPEVRSLPSSNLLCEREEFDYLKGCKQVEMETYLDSAAPEDGSGDKLCAATGSYITGSMMAQQNDLEEQVDYCRDPVQDDACEISTSQLTSNCRENSESLPLDMHETSDFNDDTHDEKSFNSEACMQFKEDEGSSWMRKLISNDDFAGIHVNFAAEDGAITGHKLQAMEEANSSISLSVEGRDGMESAIPQINQGENTSLDTQRVGELDVTDVKMMLKRNKRSVLIHGTPKKPLLPTIDMKENMAAPKRMQMVNATATKPVLKRKALQKIWK
ncbi:hypothetical protein KSS87_008142 [Heliosperma pusillum]|nr:hypothetical protein KSS87_008142 [Heliosperma pusillum]